jgi:pimeloyl-ACP methyl ester carboxylesterase
MRRRHPADQPLDASVVRVAGPWEHQMVAANGARFHVVVAGAGPLVLMLHGFPEFWWAWRHQLRALAAQGYRAAAMDLRGYGASDKTPRGYDPFTLSADVAGVVRSLGERDAVVVGHGWGGLVAWSAAVIHPRQVRRLAAVSVPHPRRLRAAVLRDVGQLRAGRHVLGYQLPLLPERRLVADGGAEVRRLLQAWAGPGWPGDEEAGRYGEAICIPGVAHCAMEGYRWAVRSLARPDGLRYAARMKAPVTVPTLQLQGALDGPTTTRSATGSGRYVDADYRWHLLPGVGHFPHEEDPTMFSQLLVDWLDDEAVDRA